MNKKGILLTVVGVLVLLALVVYSTIVIFIPKPLEVQGEVDATQIRVASKVVGRLDSLPVHKGEAVKKGQLLFVLSSPEINARLAQANAALQGARAQNSKAVTGAEAEDIAAANNMYLKALAAYDLALKTNVRIQNLYKEGVVPGQKKDESEAQLKAALETANAAKELWSKAKKGTRIEDKEAAMAMVDRAEGAISEVQSFLNETRITAPADGEIADIIAEQGELVSAGYPVVTIVDLSDCWVTFNLREDLLASIKPGSEFEAKFPALGNRNIMLKVTYIHPLGNFATWNATKTSGDFDMKTFEVHARPVNPVEGLRPGMSALVNWKKVAASIVK
ncbi:MAG: efflux RND transporter periplasmic adaptor subunit [Bacteroidetes bacterium]|nr:efflux RND transporter periplasmic adaptor subunit [Bacteroidota bacterium]